MKTVKKALTILESFTYDIRYQGVTEIANKLGFKKSTTHALLKALKDEGYIIHEPNTKKYFLGFKLLELSKRISYKLDLRNTALPVMQDLAKVSGEDIALNIFVEGRRLCIEMVESRYFVRQFVPLGKALPLHCSAAGKAILAFQSRDKILSIVERYGLRQFTENTITDKNQLCVELGKIKKQGYAESREEYGKDAASIGFPLFNNNDFSIGSLSIQSTINRITDKTRKKLIEEGLKAAERINSRLSVLF